MVCTCGSASTIELPPVSILYFIDMIPLIQVEMASGPYQISPNVVLLSVLKIFYRLMLGMWYDCSHGPWAPYLLLIFPLCSAQW